MSDQPPVTPGEIPSLSQLLFPKAELPDLVLHYSGRSQKGARYGTCEDSLIAFAGHGRDGCERPLQGSARLREEDLILAVSDGMGGRAAGEIASRTVVDSLAELVPRAFRTAALGLDPDIGGLLEESLSQANDRLYELGEGDAARRGLGATLTLGWFSPRLVHLAHIGDSRAYRWRAGELVQLSQDHSLPGALQRQGKLNEREWRTHPRRNVLTRAMGCGHRTILPQFDARSVEAGDRFLFCSDGLIDGLWDKHLAEELSREEPVAELSARLLNRAYTTAGSDDTSLFVVAVEPAEGDPSVLGDQSKA